VTDRFQSGWTRAAEKNWEAIFGPSVPVDRLENVELAEIVWAMPSPESAAPTGVVEGMAHMEAAFDSEHLWKESQGFEEKVRRELYRSMGGYA